MFNHILLAANDLELGKQAARMAGDAARSFEASDLCIVVTFPPVSDYLGTRETEQAIAERVAKATALAEALRQEAGRIPGKVQTSVLEGSLAQVAAVASRVRGSDLIVMNAKDLGFWGKLRAWFRIGRTLDGAPCPVLLAQDCQRGGKVRMEPVLQSAA